MNITAFNPETDALERTFLAQSYGTGVTSIEVKNNQKFNNNDRIMIGEMGLAYTEIVTAGTPNANGTTLPIGPTLFSHEADTPIYQLQFDQAQYYRSTNGVSGTYTLINTSNLDVTSADLSTVYNDLTGLATYYYKIAFYNSVSAVISAYSDPILGSGYSRNTVGHLIDEILNELSDPNEQNINRNELMGYFNEVNDDLLMGVVKPYNFLRTRQVFSRTAGATSLAWPTDASGNQLMWKFDHMDYNFVDSTTTPVTNNTYTVEVVPLTYFRNRHLSNENDSTTQDNTVQIMTLNEATKTFDYYPGSATSSSAVWYLYYWTYFTAITSEGNVIQTPTPRIYKLYSLYKYYLKRSVTEPAYLQIADRHLTQYMAERNRLKGQDRRDAGTPRRFMGEGWVSKSFRR